ncbi:preprotein translocase subunit SecG [Novilysobacter defluvii]|uniref:Protein-export membrane protein SecG n=1 Tax=Lysobacter defluvii IMMIB APB-9 = DSM 18482 TaxID=1385515 RepID=A0A0A0M649_9GAMM|nr:preprotein translocase subunit SecG [Lysobacter defluvii]KGO98550.1 preprotein translocase subunit SecG [Lysobacter defluvii IMMIB APB-9 = DSM 18482]
MLLFLNVIYVLLAIAMIALILMQRGAGAQAGSGFGGGASATVFGSRGASSFLSKSTKWLAITFFAISLFMAWNATRNAPANIGDDLGVMSQVPVAPATPADGGQVPAAPQQAPAGEVPVAPQAAEPPESAPSGTAEN